MKIYFKLFLTLTLLNTLSLNVHARNEQREDKFDEVPAKSESINPRGRKELLEEQERQMQEEGPLILEKKDETRDNKELRKRQYYFSQ